jgi:hypothetical protein
MLPSYTIGMQFASQIMMVSLKNTLMLLIMMLGIFIFSTTPAHAQVGIPAGGVELDGYAWSSNIGWISMNCKTGGATGNDICATSNYKATVQTDGTVTGYAWSSNIGWIRFGGLSNFPTAAGTMAVNARMTGTYPDLTFEGWVRACAGDDMNASCTPVVATSTGNGIVWTKHGTVTNASRAISRVAYGNGRYVSLGSLGSYILTSPDGITWTQSTNLTGPWTNITFGNGMFVAVANSGTNRIATSPDGLTWTTRVAPVNNAWQDVIFGNGQFVAMACGAGTTCNSTAGTRIMTSPDGITWTARTSPASDWRAIAYGGGQYVVVGISSAMTSPDGITWTTRTFPATNGAYVAYGNGKFVASVLASGGSPNDFEVLTSSDGGVTWSQTLVPGDTPQSLTFFDPYFVMGAWGFNSTDPVFLYISTDGVTWTRQNYFNPYVTTMTQFYGGVGAGKIVFTSSMSFVDSYYTGVLATSSYTGTGWDGWISLRSTAAPTYSVVMSSTGASATSYAWGSTVVGWINFDDVRFLTPTATLSGTNCTIPAGASTCNSSFSWNIQNAASPNLRNSTRSVTYTTNAAGTTTPYAITQGANTVQARDNNTVLASVVVNGTCAAGTDFANGTTCETTVVPAPVITITTNKTIARTGDTVLVSWTMNPSPIASGTCSVSGPGMPASVTTTGSQTSNALSSKTRFTLTCTGAYGTVRANADVEIIPKASEV